MVQITWREGVKKRMGEGVVNILRPKKDDNDERVRERGAKRKGAEK